MNIIGIDLGGTNVAAALVVDGKLSTRTRDRTRKESAEDVLLQLEESISRVLERSKLTLDDIDGVGVAVPGWIDAPKGFVISSPNLPLKQVELAKRLEAYTHCPVKIENDANCAALGELAFGAATDGEDFLLLTVGTGFGAGMVINNKLINQPCAGELAHVVMDLNGPQCGCGRRGCVETFVSATALLRITQETVRRHPKSVLFSDCFFDGERIFEAYGFDDPGAIASVNIYLDYFAEALLNFVTIFGPIKMIIGGGIADAGDNFFVPLREKLELAASKTIIPMVMPEIIPAGLRNNAGIYGAAALFENLAHEGEANEAEN